MEMIMNNVDGKTIFSAGSYGLFFIIAAVIVGLGLYLIFLAAQSLLKAKEANRFPTAAFVVSVLAGVVISIPVYPLTLLAATNDLVVEAEDQMIEFTLNMIRITSRGFTLYKLADGSLPTNPDATPTPLYKQDGTPVYATETAVPPEPTATPDLGVYAGETAVPTLPAATATATWTVLNLDEGPPTPTMDIAELTTRNAEQIISAPPTLNPDTWNILTPVATPVR